VGRRRKEGEGGEVRRCLVVSLERTESSSVLFYRRTGWRRAGEGEGGWGYRVGKKREWTYGEETREREQRRKEVFKEAELESSTVPGFIQLSRSPPSESLPLLRLFYFFSFLFFSSLRTVDILLSKDGFLLLSFLRPGRLGVNV